MIDQPRSSLFAQNGPPICAISTSRRPVPVRNSSRPALVLPLATRRFSSAGLPALAVEHRHLLLGVAIAGGRAGWNRPLDAREVLFAQLDLERGERLQQLLARA